MSSEKKPAHAPTRADQMFNAISERTNFNELVERPEWPEIQKKIVRTVNSYQALLDFAERHHEYCEECDGSDRIYNNADPTSGQWVPCPYSEAIEQAKGRQP